MSDRDWSFVELSGERSAEEELATRFDSDTGRSLDLEAAKRTMRAREERRRLATETVPTPN